MAYWGVDNWEIVKNDGVTYSLTFDTDGTPVDVSAWVSYYKATKRNATTVVIALTSAAGDITYSDSGSGTTDTVNIVFDETDTAVASGLYDHQLIAVIGGVTTTVLIGSLKIADNIAAVA